MEMIEEKYQTSGLSTFNSKKTKMLPGGDLESAEINSNCTPKGKYNSNNIYSNAQDVLFV